MNDHSNRRGISPIVAGLLAIVTVVAIVILVYVFAVAFLGGLQTTSPSGITATILPNRIYSADANIAALNDNVSFSISISNSLSTTQPAVVIVSDATRVVQSIPVSVRPGATEAQLVSQRLNSTGIWTIKVTAGGNSVQSYSFTVEATRDVAAYEVNQWRLEQFYRYLTVAGFGVAMISLLLALGALARRH